MCERGVCLRLPTSVSAWILRLVGAGSGTEEPTLPVASVARRLGVAPSTLRTWDRRYGLGPSRHTDGRHRRYGTSDIGRLELMQRALLSGASTAEAARYALEQIPRSGSPQPEEPEEPPDPGTADDGHEVRSASRAG